MFSSQYCLSQWHNTPVSVNHTTIIHLSNNIYTSLTIFTLTLHLSWCCQLHHYVLLCDLFQLVPELPTYGKDIQTRLLLTSVCVCVHVCA